MYVGFEEVEKFTERRVRSYKKQTMIRKLT